MVDEMTTIKEGSKWTSNDGKIFYVKAVVEVDNNKWVYYGEYASDREYSCYQESFEHRFKQVLE